MMVSLPFRHGDLDDSLASFPCIGDRVHAACFNSLYSRSCHCGRSVSKLTLLQIVLCVHIKFICPVLFIPDHVTVDSQQANLTADCCVCAHCSASSSAPFIALDAAVGRHPPERASSALSDLLLGLLQLSLSVCLSVCLSLSRSVSFSLRTGISVTNVTLSDRWPLQRVKLRGECYECIFF